MFEGNFDLFIPLKIIDRSSIKAYLCIVEFLSFLISQLRSSVSANDPVKMNEIEVLRIQFLLP